MTDECRHGKHHFHHHHHHVGLAEGITPVYVKKLQLAMLLAILYFVTQLFGSFSSGSLALLADAGHKLADIGAIGLALFASWFSNLSSSPRKTFGYHRLEILAALINGTGLIIIAFLIIWEALSRVGHHSHFNIEGGVMLGVSVLGLFINIISARVLFPARELNLNVKGALFHLMADIMNSVGEILTAVGILLFHLTWLDTLVSLVIALLVLYNASRLFREALNILMESAPEHLNIDDIREFILQKAGVTDVHDLHVWTITTGKDALLAHVRVTSDMFAFQTAHNLERDLRETFDLCHITVQLEPPGFEEEAPPF
jgi:cobalt-zinc-cadmium efflux system protein